MATNADTAQTHPTTLTLTVTPSKTTAASLSSDGGLHPNTKVYAYTMHDLVELTGLSKWTIYEAISKGDLDPTDLASVFAFHVTTRPRAGKKSKPRRIKKKLSFGGMNFSFDVAGEFVEDDAA